MLKFKTDLFRKFGFKKFEFVSDFVFRISNFLVQSTSSLASSQFARRYYGNHYYFLFLCLLRCFSSARARILPYPLLRGLQIVALLTEWVTPFGNRRLMVHRHQPVVIAVVDASFLGSFCQGIHHWHYE